MDDYVVNDDGSVCIIIDVNAVIACKQFPFAIKVINEVNKCLWAIGRAKRHHSICSFYCIGPLKS
jgi:hypothetical protein